MNKSHIPNVDKLKFFVFQLHVISNWDQDEDENEDEDEDS
jgi:hypothetical protein